MTTPRQTFDDTVLKEMLGKPTSASAISFVRGAGGDVHSLDELLQWGTNVEMAAGNSRVTAWRWDFEKKQLEYAPHFREIFGLGPLEPVNYDTWVAHLHPSVREEAKHDFMQFIKGRSRRRQIEQRFVTVDGETRWVQTRSVVERNAVGKPLRVTSICIDVTEEKNMELKLRESEERLRALFDQSAVGIARFDRSGRYLEVNDKFCGITGYPREELLHMNVSEIRHPEDSKVAPGVLLAQLASGNVSNFSAEERYLRKNGSTGWLLRGLSTGRDGAGTPQYFISIVQDITDRKQIEHELKDGKERLEAAAAASGTGTFRLDLQTKEWTWDHNVARLVGLPSGQTLETLEQLLAVVVPEDRQRLEEYCDRCCKEGGVCEIEFRIAWPDGTIHSLYCRGKAFADKEGQPAHITGAFMDLTDQKAVHDQLHESREFLLLAESAAGIGLWEWNPATDRQKWSPETYRLFGISQEQEAPTMQASLNLVHPDDRPRIIEVVGLIERGRQEHFEAEFRVPITGETRWIRCTARVQRDPAGSANRVIGAIYDTTAHRQAEERLRTAEKLAVAGKMAASMAHEINNPLGAVMNLLYLINNCSSLPEARKLSFMAQEEIRRVTQLTIHSLRFHRQSSRASRLRISAVVEAVALLYQSRLRLAGVEIIRDFRDTLLLMCWADDLRQLFGNLISNAVEALPEGGRVRLKVFDRKDRRTSEMGVCAVIADTGPGMSPETKSRLFEPFFSTKQGTGIGLGLWVSSEIVKKHGGFIRIRSSQARQHHGTVVSVFLPSRMSEKSVLAA